MGITFTGEFLWLFLFTLFHGQVLTRPRDCEFPETTGKPKAMCLVQTFMSILQRWGFLWFNQSLKGIHKHTKTSGLQDIYSQSSHQCSIRRNHQRSKEGRNGRHMAMPEISFDGLIIKKKVCIQCNNSKTIKHLNLENSF